MLSSYARAEQNLLFEAKASVQLHLVQKCCNRYDLCQQSV